jgi:hypothetical protein
MVSGLMGINPPFRIMTRKLLKNPAMIGKKLNFLRFISEKTSKTACELTKISEAIFSEKRTLVAGRTNPNNCGIKAINTRRGAFSS